MEISSTLIAKSKNTITQFQEISLDFRDSKKTLCALSNNA